MMPSSGAVTVSWSRIASAAARAAPAAVDSLAAARTAARRAAGAAAAAASPSYCCADTMPWSCSGFARARSFAARALSASAALTSLTRRPAPRACACRWRIRASRPGCSGTATVSPRRTVSPSSLRSRTRRPVVKGASRTSRISTVPEICSASVRSAQPATTRTIPAQRGMRDPCATRNGKGETGNAAAALRPSPFSRFSFPVSPRPTHPASPIPHPVMLAVRLQPVDRIQGDPALPAHLEVEVRPPVARLAAHVPDDLALRDPFALGDGGLAEVAVEAVVPAAVIEQDRREIGAERPGEAHAAGRDGAHRRTCRCRDPDAVPGDPGVVGPGRGTELVDDPAVHGPVELAQIGRGDRRGRRRGAPCQSLPPGALQGRDAVVQVLLVALELGETLLRFAGAPAGLPERRLPRALEREIALQLLGALALAAPQGVARVDEHLALAGDPPLQLEHVVREQPVLPAHEVEVLVARQEVAEALGGEQHLVGVERPAFVDVREAVVEHRPLLLEGVLGEQQVHGGAVDLPRDAVDLAVQLVVHAVRRLLLPLEVRELVRERVHLRLEPLQLALDLGPLATDVFQTTLV